MKMHDNYYNLKSYYYLEYINKNKTIKVKISQLVEYQGSE